MLTALGIKHTEHEGWFNQAIDSIATHRAKHDARLATVGIGRRTADGFMGETLEEWTYQEPSMSFLTHVWSPVIRR